MKKTNTILVLVIAVAVNLCTGYSIKDPVAISGSFSGSSSSSSAFAHSSSSSYTFNGPINHGDLESLKAGAGAGAGAIAGAGSGTGALAGSAASAFAGSGAIAGGSGAGAGSSAGSLANGGSDYIGGANAGSDANGGVIVGTDNKSACGEGNSDCKETQNSNVIGVSTGPIDLGSYKVINNNQYTTGYSKGTNYAIGGAHGQGIKSAAGGCLTCKGPFPGPNGSIHDYKLASSIPNKAGGASNVQPGHHTGTQGNAVAGSGAGSFYQPSVSTNSLPGPTGSIYISKPAPSVSSDSAYHGTGFVSGHISPSLIATFPGPSGSIHDSKPAGSGAIATAGATAGSGSYNSNSGSVAGLTPGHSAILPGPSGSIYDSKPAALVPSHGAAGAGSVSKIPSNGPVVEPTCSYSPGSPNKNCGGAVSSTASGQSATGVTGILPGPSGSIYDSKPAAVVPSHGAASGAGANAVSSSGSVSNIPSAHPVVGPACSYTPGSPNKNCGGASSGFASGQSATGVIGILPGPSGSIYDSKPAGSVSTHSAASGAGANAVSSSGSVSNIPSVHPVVGPACSNTPGSPNKNCGGASSGFASGQSATGVIGILPGPSGSIYDSKPAGSVSTHGAASGAGSVAGAGTTTGTSTHYSNSGSTSNIPILPGPSESIYSSKPIAPTHEGHSGAGAGASAGASTESNIESNAVSNIPSSHAVVGPACAYTPGSPNKNCEGTVSGTTSGQGAAGVIAILPGSSGSIYDSKPASSLPAHGATSGGVAGAGSVSGSGLHIGSGIISNIPPALVDGPACSYTAGVKNKCGSSQHAQNNAGASASAGATAQAGTIHPPSIHPEGPSGTYYINKPSPPATEIQAPSIHSSPSFGGQIPCADSTCGSEIQHKENGQAGTSSGAYAGSQSGSVVYVDKDKTDQYHSINHDEAHKSGGIVYENEDGTYHNEPKTSKPTYNNAEKGGYAVSSDEADNTGFLIGPGTGNLPIEKDAKPFGTQGAFGGSAAFVKGASQTNDKTFGTQGAFGGSEAYASGTANTNDKPFGTQGAFGGSAAFSKSSASAQSSGSQFMNTRPCTLGDCSTSGYKNKNNIASGANGDVVIQKIEGTLVSPVNNGASTSQCFKGKCNSEAGTNFENAYNKEQSTIDNAQGSIVKEICTGASCGDTEVYIIKEEPSTGYGTANGFATGQVLVQNGNGATNDITNHGLGENAISGSNAGTYYENPSGCSTGRCGGPGFGAGGSFGLVNSAGILDKLFGAGGPSGQLHKFGGSGYSGANAYSNAGSGHFNKLGGSGFGGSAAYSNAGSYASASAGSFASAGATAHAGSFAHSF